MIQFFQLPFVQQLILIIVTFFAPLIPAMIAILLLVIIDTITAIIAAHKSNEAITSKKFGGSVTKLLVYQLLIISAHLCEKFLFPQVAFVKITLAFLATTEFISISENFQKTTGLSFIKYIKKFLDEKLRGFIKIDDKTDTPTS